jgi:sec-independent protein translocase protein TatB
MNLVPGVGFFEIMVIAVVALVVVGPKDLPRLMRTAGQWAARARRMASEFTNAFHQMAREAEMEDMRREIDALKKTTRLDEMESALKSAADPLGATLSEESQRLRDAQAKLPG